MLRAGSISPGAINALSHPRSAPPPRASRRPSRHSRSAMNACRRSDRNRCPASPPHAPHPACAWRSRAVVGEARDIGIEIERAVDRQKLVEPDLRQALDQNAAVLLIAVLDRLHLVAAVEGGLGRDLRQRRHRDGEILLQPLDRPHQRLRHHHPADAPAGHAEIFRERIDHDAHRPTAARAVSAGNA